jgi:hypothetical protein
MFKLLVTSMIGKMGARNVDNFAMGVTLMHLLQAMLQAVIGSNTVETSFIRLQ